MKKLLLQLEDYMILKNYAKATQKSYLSSVRKFIIWCHKEKDKPGYDKENAHRKYLVNRRKSGKAWQTVNSDYSAIMMLYVYILNRKWDEQKLPRPRIEKSLPTILSQEQVKQLIYAGSIYKHQVLMVLLYSTGLRVSEAVGLELSSLDFDRMQIHVKKGKGLKDRIVQMPEILRETLVEYFEQKHPYKYVFNGKDRGCQLSVRAAQKAVYEAKKRTEITKQVSVHTFRHCYATHHLEGGTDLVTLQKQLGHKRLSTTAIYVQLCEEHFKRIHHPINDLGICLKNTTSGILCENMGSSIWETTQSA